ncbi:MAG: APC family permease [Burkholderiales bacterium]|nr:APC family permease [Burkholderiales bacterium]
MNKTAQSHFFERLRHIVLGPPHDPLKPETRQAITLIAFFAWVGLGADGLSSSAYGPELTFRALGEHAFLGLYMCFALVATVFIIALAYNQVIDLFPSGGGGYKVATVLIGPKAGLVSGCALIVDYVLTITISVASGVDTLVSLFPVSEQAKLTAEVGLIFVLIYLNLRGMKEAIHVLVPIFLAFVVLHAALIVYGIAAHADNFPVLVPEIVEETKHLAGERGWLGVIWIVMLAYAASGATYTGLEAVTNNVNTLKEPRVRTGKLTMFYVASSLAIAAGGIMLLYVLWDAQPVEGQTLNAVVFRSILSEWTFFGIDWATYLLPLVLVSAGGLLFVAANTGFLGGPAVLANMAVDQWVPNQFSSLSSRLVTKHGVFLMGMSAIVILVYTRGEVALLAVIYALNVFLTFSISLFGLCLYWWRHRHEKHGWWVNLGLSALALAITGTIFIALFFAEFTRGGWLASVITGAVIIFCLLIRRHYVQTRGQIKKIDEIFLAAPCEPVKDPPPIDKDAATAVFMVSRSRGTGIHTMLWVQRLFPGNFKNFVFLSVGAVDTAAYGGEGALEALQRETHAALEYYVNFCHQHGIAAAAYEAYGTDRIAQLTKLVDQVTAEYPNCVFFASKLVFVHDNWFTRSLHNQTPLAMQRILHLRGQQMVILPMKIE